MAYFNGSGALARPYVAPSAIYCDPCAESAIPLPAPKGDATDGQRHHATEFKWAPYYGAPCSKCGGRA